MIKDEIRGEKKYGIQTTGADELKKLEAKGIDTLHATIYMPVSYMVIEKSLEKLKQVYPSIQSHFIDIGCGKGRALCVAAHYGFKKITGIDFSKEFCDVAKLNCGNTKLKIPDAAFDVINNDAFYYEIPESADCIFLFNPFDEIIMSGVVKNIRASLKNTPRTLAIIYVNPLHRSLFENAGFKEFYHGKTMEYLEVCMLINT
jgi:SAM-dependent methyltransferase